MSSGWLLGGPPGIFTCESGASSLYKWAKKVLLLKQEDCYFIAKKTRDQRSLLLLCLTGMGSDLACCLPIGRTSSEKIKHIHLDFVAR